MTPLNWEDVPQGDTYPKQNVWFGATIFLIAVIVGFILGNFIK